MTYKLNKITILLCASCSSWAMAQEQMDTMQSSANTLHEIVVYAEQNASLSSAQTVSQKDMSVAPATNNNISDYLKLNPHVRFVNSDENTMLRGEIKPAEISINGAEASQTSYFVDNVNMNNDLGIGADLFDGVMATIPRADYGQAYFFDTNLLSSVTVYDSNISASLGGFSGGAVVAKTKQYGGEDHVQLRYRTTRAAWAKFHVAEGDRAKFEEVLPNGMNADFQPKYNKHFVSLSAEKGISDNLGVVFGISRRGANIQQNRLISPDGQMGKRNHTRRSDNGLVNFSWTPNEQHRIEWGLRYSNYRESKFYATNLHSDIHDYHQAFGTTLAWVNGLPAGILTTTLAYDDFRDKRKSASTYMKTIIDSQGLEYSQGGMGNSTLNQKNWHISAEYALNPFSWGDWTHSISLGGIYQFTQYAFNRAQDAHSELYMDSGFGLIPLDQHSVRKGTVKAKYQNIAFYAEDLMKWAQLEFRPGIRIERDDYLRNTNIAPRFAMRWQFLEDSALNFGLNRYYGRSFASMKLAEQIFQLDGHDTFRYQDVKRFKTPHADELTIGIEQGLGNVMMKFNYIHRQNKNRIVLHESENALTGEKERYYKKGKDYHADIYTLAFHNIEPWELGLTQWQTTLAFDWLRMKGLDFGRGYNADSQVILDGKWTSYGDMMKKVNNHREEWVARLGIHMAIPAYHVSWTNNVFVKAPIKGIEHYDDLNSIPLYRRYDYGTHTQWDSSIRWQPMIHDKHSVYVKLDILNVLNKTRKGMTSKGEDYGFYTAGREFWLELGYEF
ncbi:TonB-dependent receptor plug domain-containing protein [Conservatibacter flavescens]|uniref:TonB-dependent receptor n=1 Tax=Conservatibacter flavescens TaxID=28161 RepID=A0A2M8S046_9PAST|nr:TonB-dependent receptor [Conservatibacter flavescens]PJG84522.1 TonB-dependent receptor [Conservatibacter flavescens]